MRSRSWSMALRSRRMVPGRAAHKYLGNEGFSQPATIADMRSGLVEARIDRTWDGKEIPESDVAVVTLRFGDRRLEVEVDAPLNGDPPPPSAPGPTEALWNHEVVEVFLLGSSGYLEVELGPHGHYLVMELGAPRVVETSLIPIEYSVRNREGSRWQARAVIENHWLPAGLDRFNAYRICGLTPQRRYLAAFPMPGEKPDFHKLECFGPLEVG